MENNNSQSNLIEPGLVHEPTEELKNALIDNGLVDVWNGLTPIARNEFICWIIDAKQDKTKSKRVLRAVDELKEGMRRPCCWPGCIHRTDKKPSKWQQDVLIDKKAKS